VPVGNRIVDRTNKHIRRPNSLDLADVYAEITDDDSCRAGRHGIAFGNFARLTEVAGYYHDLGAFDASVGATVGARI
jgi:hypothetical protein